MKILIFRVVELLLLFQFFDDTSTASETLKVSDIFKLWNRSIGDEIWPWASLPTGNSNTTFHCSQPYEGSNSKRMFTNCSSPENKYPAAHITCLCASMTSKQVKLTCHAGKWYPDQPGVCAQHCLPTSIPSNVICDNIPGEAKYSAHLNCNCRNNCLSAPLWCGQRGNWLHYTGDHHCNKKFGEETKDGVVIRVNDNAVMMSCGSHIRESKCVDGKIVDPMPQCLTAGSMDGNTFTSSTIIVITLSTFLIIAIAIIIVMFALWYNRTGGCCSSNEEQLIDETEMSNRPMSTNNKYSPSPHIRRVNLLKSRNDELKLKFKKNKTEYQNSFKTLSDSDLKNSDKSENTGSDNKLVFKGKEIGVLYNNFDNEEAENNIFENPINKKSDKPEYQNFAFEHDESQSPEYQNFQVPQFANTCNDVEYQNASALGYNQEEEELDTNLYANTGQIFTISKGKDNDLPLPSTSSDYDRPNPTNDPYRYDSPKYTNKHETKNRETVESNIYDDPDMPMYDDVILNKQRY